MGNDNVMSELDFTKISIKEIHQTGSTKFGIHIYSIDTDFIEQTKAEFNLYPLGFCITYHLFRLFEFEISLFRKIAISIKLDRMFNE